MVVWSSWLWHLVNTEKVLSSILRMITNACVHFLLIVSTERGVDLDFSKSLDAAGILPIPRNFYILKLSLHLRVKSRGTMGQDSYELLRLHEDYDNHYRDHHLSFTVSGFNFSAHAATTL